VLLAGGEEWLGPSRHPAGGVEGDGATDHHAPSGRLDLRLQEPAKPVEVSDRLEAAGRALALAGGALVAPEAENARRHGVVVVPVGDGGCGGGIVGPVL